MPRVTAHTATGQDALSRLLLSLGGQQVESPAPLLFCTAASSPLPLLERRALTEHPCTGRGAVRVDVQPGGPDAFRALAELLRRAPPHAETPPFSRLEGFVGYALRASGVWTPHAWAKSWGGVLVDSAEAHLIYHGFPLLRQPEEVRRPPELTLPLLSDFLNACS